MSIVWLRYATSNFVEHMRIKVTTILKKKIITWITVTWNVSSNYCVDVQWMCHTIIICAKDKFNYCVIVYMHVIHGLYGLWMSFISVCHTMCHLIIVLWRCHWIIVCHMFNGCVSIDCVILFYGCVSNDCHIMFYEQIIQLFFHSFYGCVIQYLIWFMDVSFNCFGILCFIDAIQLLCHSMIYRCVIQFCHIVLWKSFISVCHIMFDESVI